MAENNTGYGHDGLFADLDTDSRRIASVQYAFGAIGICILTIMVFLTLREGKVLYAGLTTGLLLAIGSGVGVLKVTGNTAVTSLIFSVSIAALSTGLLCTGGIQNNGPMWIFIFPPLLYFMTGIRWGSVTVLGIFVISLLVLYLPQWPMLDTDYPSHFKIRFSLAYACVSLIAASAEWSRYRLHRKLLHYAEKLASLSITDDLTGINNRRGGIVKMDYVHAASRRSRKGFCLILADLDHFKRINDTWGHDCGDAVLKSAASLFRKTVRSRDIVIRWGGEEFLMVLPETDLYQGGMLAERMRKSLEEMVVDFNGVRVPVTASFGVSQCEPEDRVSVAVDQADRELYVAKEGGRNRVSKGRTPLSGSSAAL